MVHSEKERKEDLDDKDDRPNFFLIVKNGGGIVGAKLRQQTLVLI